MKKFVYVILLLLILGGAGFFIYSKNKSGKTPVREYGILNPNPNAGSTAILDTTNLGRNDSGQVLGETQTSAPASTPETPKATTPEPKKEEQKEPKIPAKVPAKTPAPATATKTTAAIKTENGLSTYKIAQLNFSVMVPTAWQPRLETAAGNVLAFYNAAGAQVGQIEVIPDAEQSYDSLVHEVSSNPNVSNIQQITINGQPAIIFNDQRYGNGRVIAVAYKNNVYYLRGENAQRPYSEYFKFIN